METGIDCMKYRKSTHLAGVDVEAIIAEKGKCELTIKLAYYDIGVNVSGNKTDGYFLKFEEPVKELVVNSGNRKRIAELVRAKKQCTAVESRNIANWAGMKISLIFDPTIKFGREIVGGIVVETKLLQDTKTLPEAMADFNAVNSRESFVKAMTDNKEFMSNQDIINKCKELAVIYPAPAKK